MSRDLLEGVHHVLPSPPAPVAGATPLTPHEAEEATAEDVGEDVVHAGPAPTTLPQALLAVAVVQLLFLRVGEHLVGEADLFELEETRGFSTTHSEYRNNQPRLLCMKGLSLTTVLRVSLTTVLKV